MCELGLGAVALQHIGRRERPGGALIGGRALHDDPVDASGAALRCGVGHILKAAIDDGFEPIDFGHRLLVKIIAITPVTPLLCTALARSSAAAAGTRAIFIPARLARGASSVFLVA